MKKAVMSLVLMLSVMFGGCAMLDAPYSKVRTFYINGKKVVVNNWDELGSTSKTLLKKFDKGASSYDKTRTSIRKKDDVK